MGPVLPLVFLAFYVCTSTLGQHLEGPRYGCSQDTVECVLDWIDSSSDGIVSQEEVYRIVALPINQGRSEQMVRKRIDFVLHQCGVERLPTPKQTLHHCVRPIECEFWAGTGCVV
eukprot:TRINITY_DN107728_c0_g1_i1.p1 TRINITY_DN107728_c0_g1~~TRINITY_DN107728_c0_g1_i1.p1  ORF type:complete len:115 (+),score=9.72 TRINITY_DN107728_c0_g1_i1:91-435(+)